MQKTSRKILSVLLAVIMVLSIVPTAGVVSFAATSGDYEYSVLSEDDKTCGITDYTGSATELTIPSAIDGYTVTSIAYGAFSGCTSLKSIMIPNSVTSIGIGAFYDTAYYNNEDNWENGVLYIGNHLIEAKTNISGSYEIKEGTLTIADEAFYGCKSLKSVTIPDSVTRIGDSAFCDCSSLKSTNVDVNNKYYSSDNGVLFNEDKTELIQYPAGKTDTSYVIPDSVTSIGEYAFSHCTSLTSVTIPDSVTNIESFAFWYCTSLESITIPDNVMSIGSYAFDNTAYYNNSDNWENGVLYIGNYLIETNYTDISGSCEIKEGTLTIADWAFYYCKSLTSATIPDSVTSIGDWAFASCTSLASVTIPDSVTSIGSRTFSGCTSLTSVTIPDSVTSIGWCAFENCTSLKSVTIPDSVTSIGSWAFGNCSSLKSVTIPDSVTSIGDEAFLGCTSLTDVYYAGTETQWNNISIGSNNECLINAEIHYNSFSEQSDGMRIIINNSSLSYYVGDAVAVCVSDFQDGEEFLPEGLVVYSSDSTVLKYKDMYDFSDLPLLRQTFEAMKKCKYIIFEAVSAGAATVTINNTETGEVRKIPISVAEDSKAGLRADNVPVKTYKCAWETDTYNGYVDGIYIADFEYKEVSGGYNFSMNLYNENYCNGVVEVYDADGKLINVKDIQKFESLTKGIYETFEAGYTIIKDAVEGDTFSFRSEATSKCTEIKDLYVPQDGMIKITADITSSKSCLIDNMIDLLFTGLSLSDDIKSFVKGVDSFNEDSIGEIKAAVFAKWLASEEYIKIGDKIQEKYTKKLYENMTEASINTLTTGVLLDLEDVFEEMDLDLDGLLKTVFGSGAGIAEGLFEKAAGPVGLVLKSIFLVQEVQDFINDINDIRERMTGGVKFGCYTPVKYSSNTVLKNEFVTLDTLSKAPANAVMESHKVVNGNAQSILLDDGSTMVSYEQYEITLYSDGEEIQPTGMVEVQIDCDLEKATVAALNESGSWETVECSLNDGKICFSVSKLGTFVICEDTVYFAEYDKAVKQANAIDRSQYTAESLAALDSALAVDVSSASQEEIDAQTEAITDALNSLVKRIAMYRLYNPNSGEHFYTSNVGEKDNLVSLGWNYEGIGWYAPSKSATPVYRLYNKNGGEHHYTASVTERDRLVSLGWNYEGIGWNSDDAQGVPIYRQYNPNAFANNHNYTASKTENDRLVSYGWRYEGIGWYGVA